MPIQAHRGNTVGFVLPAAPDAEQELIGARVRLFPFAVPEKNYVFTCILFLSTAALAVPSLDPPPAALGRAAIPNTEVKRTFADNPCRVSGREDR